MKGRLGFLVKTFLWTVMVFIIAKVGFMLACGRDYTYSFGDILDVGMHGLSLDLSTALYFLIFPLLVVLVSYLWRGKVIVRILQAYFLLVSIAFALAFVADTSLYPFWGFKLDASCLQYLDSPDEAMASVSTGYLMARLLLIVLVSVLVFYPYYRITSRNPFASRPHILSVLLFLLLIPVFIVGIRGGTGESTTNIGQVYYSQNQFLNQSAVNPVFNFFYSLSHTVGDIEQYQVMSEEECAKWTSNVYTTESIDSDTLLNTMRPNILVILMESTGEEQLKAMPYLQQLKSEGIYFSNCYGNSWRTDRGTICAYSGYPSFPSVSVMKMPQKSNSLPSIASSLQAAGYSTSFLYGGDINFTNMRSYLLATGWEHVYSMDDFTSEERETEAWGVRDDITFNWLLDHLKGTAEESDTSRFFWGFSTLSSHEPWDVPIKKYDDEVLNAFAYLDQCLHNFLEPLKQTAVWNNLLIIMLPDHGLNYRDINQTKPLERNHIPMLWIGGAVREPRRIDTICNQSDLAATLLGQLRIGHDAFTFSRDVLSSTYTYPTAVHNYNNAQLLVDSTGYILYDFDARKLTMCRSTDSLRLVSVNKAILQLTTKDLKER